MQSANRILAAGNFISGSWHEKTSVTKEVCLTYIAYLLYCYLAKLDAEAAFEVSIQYRHSLDRTFHALGDATRRGMLVLLSKRGECTAGELGKPFDVAQPTVSRHLRVLEEAGLISRRVDGNTRLFRIEARAMNEAEKWFADQRRFWEGALASMDQYLENSRKAKKKRKNNK